MSAQDNSNPGPLSRRDFLSASATVESGRTQAFTPAALPLESSSDRRINGDCCCTSDRPEG